MKRIGYHLFTCLHKKKPNRLKKTAHIYCRAYGFGGIFFNFARRIMARCGPDMFYFIFGDVRY
jgi:hypothetical protein